MFFKIDRICYWCFFSIFFLLSCNTKTKKETIEKNSLTFSSVNNSKINKESFASRVNHIMDSANVAGLSFVVIENSKIIFEFVESTFLRIHTFFVINFNYLKLIDDNLMVLQNDVKL